ncbi:MAG: hypothetical protein ABWX65_08805 [Mycetocola sp.]
MNTEPARSEPDPTAPDSARRSVRVRRTPKFANFAMLGALLGAVVAFVLTVAIPPDPEYARSRGLPEFSQLQVFGFLLLICVVIGIAVALTVAILLDRRNDRRSPTVEADRVDVREASDTVTVIEPETDTESTPALEQNPPHTPRTTNEGNA